MADANTEKMPMTATASHEDMIASHKDAPLQRGTSHYYSFCKAISKAGLPFLNPRSRIVDLSARGGDWVEPLVHEAAWQCRFHLFNSTEEEARKCLGRFRMEARLGNVQEFCIDLNNDFPRVPSDLTICSFVLSSLEEERRESVLESIHKHMRKSGGLIIVERNDGEVQTSEPWVRCVEEKGFILESKIWTCGKISSWMFKKA